MPYRRPVAANQSIGKTTDPLAGDQLCSGASDVLVDLCDPKQRLTQKRVDSRNGSRTNPKRFGQELGYAHRAHQTAELLGLDSVNGCRMGNTWACVALRRVGKGRTVSSWPPPPTTCALSAAGRVSF